MSYRSKYSCPRCGSENTQKYSEIYLNGITHHSANAEFDGYIDHGNITSDIRGNADLNGTSISRLAQSCAPPEEENSGGCAIIFFVLLAAYFELHRYGYGLYIMIFFFVIGIVGAISDHQHNSTEYPKEMYWWRRSYYCHRCGHRFTVDD